MDQKQKQKKFLALGDSYTIGESVREEGRWPVQLTKRLAEAGQDFSSPVIIATTGWRTDQLKAALPGSGREKNFDLVSLLIGVNNQYQGKPVAEYEPEFEELLKLAIEYAGGDHNNVFVVSIPDYGYTPFGKEKQESISRDIDAYNEVNRKIADQYGVRYFNITELSRKGLEDPELVAADGLHPSEKMYSQWVALIERGLTGGK